MADRTRLQVEITREVAEEWTRDGRMRVPPDDTSSDNDVAFWAEVDRRLAERMSKDA